MAWPNDNGNHRKASRPLSIIDENPNDVRSHAQIREDTTSKQNHTMSPRNSPYAERHSKPTRRKAVAPLQHPVDLLLPNPQDMKEVQTIHENNRDGGHNQLNQTLSQGDTTPHSLTQDVEMCSSSDQVMNHPDKNINCNEHPSHDRNNHHFSNQNNSSKNPVLDNQFLDADDITLSTKNSRGSSLNCIDNNNVNKTSQYVLHSNQCISRSLSRDVKIVDENENENTVHLQNTNFEMLTTKRQLYSNNRYSDNSDVECSGSTEVNGLSSDENGTISMFYLSTSATSLSLDEDEDTEKRTDKQGNEADSVSLAEQITNENTKESKRDNTKGDAEEVEWKNRVKKSRSFIKVRSNASRPMRRSISATFNDSSDSDTFQDSTTRSPGSLRRFLSQQVDSTFQRDEVQKSKPRLSLFRSGLDKLPPSLYQKSSNLHQLGDPPAPSFVSAAKVADDPSSKLPIRRISAIDQSDFSLLKMTANRLHLQTRRPSVMAWKEKYNHPLNRWLNNGNDRGEDKMEWTDENIERINVSLSMLRNELIDLRLQDQSLARQFLSLRKTMNSLRLTLQCKDHKELLDEAEEDIEELRELSQLVDLPPELLSPVSSLQNLGITRMNLSSRRFSTC